MKGYSVIFLLMIFFCLTSCAQLHPGMILTQSGVNKIRTQDNPPVFDKVLSDTKVKVDRAIVEGIDVPVPKDMAGGYTHEKHKSNYRNMQSAGALYQITGEEKYAIYIKEMLLEYAKLYPKLDKHPSDKSYAIGKLFWQCLNDANWLVYTSQAYDAIYNYLTKDERNIIETQLLKPYADYISIENPKYFNRVHNHSTWGNAAVGMMALAMDDDQLLERALYGLDLKDVDALAKDNDGGFIYEKDKAKAGFFAQIDYSFSPDGYYGEGPYYQRYAMLPFMVFAQALHNKKPELEIFEYRDSILIKAVKALLNQTNQSDEFFPINDSQKGMSIYPNSVVTAVNVAYSASPEAEFVIAARKQGAVLLNQVGWELAKEVEASDDKTFVKNSLQLRDGYKGDEGGLGILRAGDDDNQTTVVFKYTAQGLGHGHYDKLSYLMYDGDTEVMQDYGAARWVNIDQKAGGRYLKENNTWAKQSIAHNTLVVDYKSHFGGVYDVANLHHSDPVFFNTNNPKANAAGAKEVNAYNDMVMNRILILWEDEYFKNPVLIDYYDVDTKGTHDYDMPYQFAGQIMTQNFDYETQVPTIMGDDHGYQHIYQEAKATVSKANIQMNWMKDSKFYTLTSLADVGDEVILARLGANDPNFNLRRDAMMIHRKKNVGNTTYLSVIENHGTYSRVTEVPIDPYPKVKSTAIIEDNEVTVSILITAENSNEWTIKVDKKTGKTSIKKK